MAFTIQHASPVAIRDRDACKQRRRRSAPRLGAARVRCCAAGTSSSPSPSPSHRAQSAGVAIQGRRAAASSVIAALIAGAGGAAFAKGPKTDVPVSGKAALGQIGEYDKLTKLAPGQPKVAVKEENRKFKPSSASKEAKGPVKESERMKAFAESKKVAAKPASDSKAAPAKKSKEPKKAAPAAKKKAAPAAAKKSKPRGNDSPGSPVPGVLLVTAIGAGACAHTAHTQIAMHHLVYNNNYNKNIYFDAEWSSRPGV